MKSKRMQDWLTDDGLILITAWARDGLSEEQIASNMGITRPTLWKWKNKEDNMLNALKKGKEVVDYEIENALHKRAMGYRYDEVTYEKGEEVKRVTKEVAPDTGAIAIWLKNRKPNHWKDRIEVDNKNVLEKLDELLEKQNNG